MPDTPMDISPLHRAVARLDEGWVRYQRDTTDEQIRDGLIQRFEFTYEISHKLLKRYLRTMSASPQEYEQMTFQDLIRTGNEANLLLGISVLSRVSCRIQNACTQQAQGTRVRHGGSHGKGA